MALNEEERRTVVNLEKEKAHRFLEHAKIMSDQKLWEMAVNRYYYASFHIVQALLIQNGLFAKTHAGLVRVLGDNFVKTGKLSDENGAFFTMLMHLRQKADYNCAFDLRQKDIDMCVNQTPLFIKAVENLLR